MLTNLLLQVVEISLTTSVLIGILLLMVPQLQKRYRVQCRYAAWIVIAVRLLIPFTFTLPLTPVEIKLPERDAVVTAPYIEDTVPQQIIQPQPDTDPLLKVTPIVSETSGIALSALSLLEIIGFVWLTGVCVFLLFQIGSYQIFLRRLHLSHKDSIPEFVKETIWKIGVDMGVGKLPEPIITSAVGAPVLIGVLHPRILLPHTKYSVEEIGFILRHEMSHYRRKDMWYKLVLLLANALHWFNPLIYVMTTQAARDIELVCDYDVTQKLNYNERTQYANTILSALPEKRRVKPMFSTQFGSSKQDMKSRLRNLFDMSIKRRGITVLCLLMLCALFGTGLVSFAYAAPDALPSQLTVIDDLLINVNAIDGTWASASSISGNTWKKQMAAEIKWLDKVYHENESDFVIKETLPITEASNTASLEYLYQNSEVFRTMCKMKNGIFQVENGQSFSGFGSAYESGMMQRTAVMIDNDEPVTLDLDYKLSQGKMAVWLVNPSGKTVYKGTQSTTYQGKQSYPGAKGLWSVITIADSKDKAIQGDISITLLSPEQDSQQPHTPSLENFSVERLGKHALAKNDVLDADLRWDGKGYVMLLYTDNKLTDNQILKPLQGLPNIPEYDKSKKDQGKLGITVNFSQSPNSPLIWNKKISDTGTYYFYLIRIINPGNVTGSVSIQKTDKTIDSIWSQKVKETINVQSEDSPKAIPILQLSNNGDKSITQSGSFQAKAGQKLTMNVTSDIKGGSVDLFLFSPSGKEQHIVFDGSDTTNTVKLSEGTWAYNATGFFQSGNIAITGSILED